jgi:hypothetical protein
LREKSARESERLCVVITGALPALDAEQALQSCIGEANRAQNESPAGSLFERHFCFHNCGIVLERLRQRGVETDRVRVYRS